MCKLHSNINLMVNMQQDLLISQLLYLFFSHLHVLLHKILPRPFQTNFIGFITCS
uniref:Uncharacterized protein n=1 Tax=Manihot esculenta TaxID=3983 RepID=A0A2C9V0Q6_MANES